MASFGLLSVTQFKRFRDQLKLRAEFMICAGKNVYVLCISLKFTRLTAFKIKDGKNWVAFCKTYSHLDTRCDTIFTKTANFCIHFGFKFRRPTEPLHFAFWI